MPVFSTLAHSFPRKGRQVKTGKWGGKPGVGLFWGVGFKRLHPPLGCPRGFATSQGGCGHTRPPRGAAWGARTGRDDGAAQLRNGLVSGDLSTNGSPRPGGRAEARERGSAAPPAAHPRLHRAFCARGFGRGLRGSARSRLVSRRRRLFLRIGARGKPLPRARDTGKQEKRGCVSGKAPGPRGRPRGRAHNYVQFPKVLGNPSEGLGGREEPGAGASSAAFARLAVCKSVCRFTNQFIRIYETQTHSF